MRSLGELLPGAHLLQIDAKPDERGHFARLFCKDTLARLGVDASLAQANRSLSLQAHTLRGLHYQLPPASETKIVSCPCGSLFDVIVDLRSHSPTFMRWASVELDANNGRMLVVPPGCAHGFLTLSERSEALYFVSTPYQPALERGLRFDDPAFAIAWPYPPRIVSARDRQHPDFDADWHLPAAA